MLCPLPSPTRLRGHLPAQARLEEELRRATEAKEAVPVGAEGETIESLKASADVRAPRESLQHSNTGARWGRCGEPEGGANQAP